MQKSRKLPLKQLPALSCIVCIFDLKDQFQDSPERPRAFHNNNFHPRASIPSATRSRSKAGENAKHNKQECQNEQHEFGREAKRKQHASAECRENQTPIRIFSASHSLHLRSDLVNSHSPVYGKTKNVCMPQKVPTRVFALSPAEASAHNYDGGFR